MRYYAVDAFTGRPGGGNRAGVVLLGDGEFPGEGTMQRAAAELRFPETAFVRADGEGRFSIRYFTPKAEVDLCGHATIATFALLHRKGLAAGRCVCRTAAGELAVEAGERVLMQMAPSRTLKTLGATEEIYRALGAAGCRPAMPVQVVQTGLADIMIPLPDVATLQALQPDMEAIAALTARHEAVSFHVFAFVADEYTAHVRDFAPLYDIPEESATGTANASLTHYLAGCGCLPAEAECRFIQGEAMGRPSVVATRLGRDGVVYVGGEAEVVTEGETGVQ